MEKDYLASSITNYNIDYQDYLKNTTNLYYDDKFESLGISNNDSLRFKSKKETHFQSNVDNDGHYELKQEEENENDDDHMECKDVVQNNNSRRNVKSGN